MRLRHENPLPVQTFVLSVSLFAQVSCHPFESDGKRPRSRLLKLEILNIFKPHINDICFGQIMKCYCRRPSVKDSVFKDKPFVWNKDNATVTTVRHEVKPINNDKLTFFKS